MLTLVPVAVSHPGRWVAVETLSSLEEANNIAQLLTAAVNIMLLLSVIRK